MVMSSLNRTTEQSLTLSEYALHYSIHPRVIPTKFQKTVQSRATTDSVGDAITVMRDESFSQLPILSNGKVVALLTTETVVRWLASEVSNQIVSPWETKIDQVLPHTGAQHHYCLLSRRATLLDALAKFEDFAAQGKDLDAILISQDGTPWLWGHILYYDIIMADCVHCSSATH